MEENINGPNFLNVFGKQLTLSRRALFYGAFRCFPMHRWQLAHIGIVLSAVAKRPKMFGLPPVPTCVVNPANFLPAFRSRQEGITVFGTDRGCKTIVVPPSCSNEPYDSLDAKMMLPLFKRNPGVELLYLSKDCRRIVGDLSSTLHQCRSLKTVVLPDWSDAVAIHRLVMSCRRVNVVDVFTLLHSKKNWSKTEEGVQALTTLIEMHPKLSCVTGASNALQDWYLATRYSRCRHNVALVRIDTLDVLAWIALWILCVFCATYAVAKIVARAVDPHDDMDYRPSSVAVLVAGICGFGDLYFRRAMWSTLPKWVIVVLWRLRLVR